MLQLLMVCGVALICLLCLYALYHQIRHRLWRDMASTWWFYCGALVVVFLFLELI